MSMSRFASRLSALIGIIGLAGASVSGCGGGGGSSSTSTGGGTTTAGLITPGTTPFTNSRQSSAAACQANAHQSGRARWTILVYMNAANNLVDDSYLNVAQLASVGSDGTNINIVLQWKQAESCNYFSSVNTCKPTQFPNSFIGTRRYFIKPHSQTDVNNIENGNTSSLEDTGERLPDPSTNTVNDSGVLTTDMGDWHALQNFVQYGETTFPADHIAVVVWDHGSGALSVDNRSVQTSGKGRISADSLSALLHSEGRNAGHGRTPNQVTRGLSQDANTGNQIATQDLSNGLSSLPQTVDALVIDCSLQATVEVAYQVRGSARVMIGSEESPPATGYPYDTWLNDLKANGQNPCALGNELLADTLAAYPPSTGYTNITQSMTDLSQMQNVATAFNAFGASLLSHVSDQTSLIYNARFNAQYYEFPEYKDLYDFADLIRTSSGVPSDLSQAAANLESSLVNTTNGAILAAVHGTAGDVLSSGLTVFLPGPNEQSMVDSAVGYDPQYANLAIANAAPNWPSFLQAQKQ